MRATSDDVMTALRAADPARRADMGRVSADALAALRDAVPAEAAAVPVQPPRRRWGRRVTLAGGLALLLAGGGVAYAGYDSWYAGGGGVDGLTCTLAYVGNGVDPERSSGGPELTGDLIADCAYYQDQVGLPQVPDPVAFWDPAVGLVVAPADQVPPGADVRARATHEDLAVRELQASAADLVDGLPAVCRTTPEALDAAQAEVDRLALAGWDVVESDVSWEPHGPCAAYAVDADARVVSVHPDSADTLDAYVEAGWTMPFVAEVRDALREGIADRCVGLADAEAVVDRAIGGEHHWPTTVVETDTRCTRVDLEVGGSMQVTLRGPQVANGR